MTVFFFTASYIPAPNKLCTCICCSLSYPLSHSSINTDVKNNKKYVAVVKKNRGHLGSVGLDSPYSQGGMDSPLLDLEKERF